VVRYLSTTNLATGGSATAGQNAAAGYRIHTFASSGTFALDAALATRAALAAGVSIKKSAAALAKFQGVLGRMQSIIDDDRLTFILDEAYHPFAIAENLQALQTRYPDRRLVVVIQPRNTGGRDGFQERDLPKALTAADRVILLRPWDFFEFPNGPFSNTRLTAAMRQLGIVVSVKPKDTKTIDYLPTRLRKRDVFYCSFPPGCDFIVSPLATLLRDTFLT
jgi:UDP-N-acetylmuramate-alanine ligase